MSQKCLQHRCLQKVDAKDNRTVTFAPFDRPPDVFASDVTKHDSSSKPHTQRGMVTFIEINTDKKIKPDANAKKMFEFDFIQGAGIEHQAADALS